MSQKSQSVILDNENEGTESGKWKKLIDLFDKSRVTKTIHSSTHSLSRNPKNFSYSAQLSIDGEENHLFLNHIRKLFSLDEDRKQLLSICNQKTALPFCETFLKCSYKDLVRIDSGSYAEVFRGYDKITDQLLVFKLIRAISEQITERVRGPELHSTVKMREICSELRSSSALSDLNNQFRTKSGKVYETHCFPVVFHKYLVEGDIPQYFLREQLSDQLTPIRKEPFEEFINIPREHAIIVMSNGGQPLWKVIKNRKANASQLISVAKQITFGLAIAEEAFEFEHRDLHVSNILLKSTEKIEINFVYRSAIYRFKSLGYEAMIIDNTFSRIKIDNKIYYKDMTEILKFDKTDSKLTSQDRVYKCMAQLTHNEWKNFTPKTNIYWLKYLYKYILNTSIMRECVDEQPKHTIREMIRKIDKCQNSHQFIRQL